MAVARGAIPLRAIVGVFVAARGTTRRVSVFDMVAARAVFALDAVRDVRGTTRRGSAIGFVLTITSIGLFVWEIVVPGFISVRILLFKYGYIYE